MQNLFLVKDVYKRQITYVGPIHTVIENLGNKVQARTTMIEANVPVIPGNDSGIVEVEKGKQVAEKVGYPIMIKAASGGGGKGMRVAFTPAEFDSAFKAAQKESEMAFGDNTMYIEHFVEHPRHIEFQILADKYGNVDVYKRQVR